jgi:hypothetical protein
MDSGQAFANFLGHIGQNYPGYDHAAYLNQFRNPVTDQPLFQLQGVDGITYAVAESTYDDRMTRLRRGPRKQLYHQTSPEYAQAIRLDGRFSRGSSGLAGAGIYFAESESETNGKAHNHGAMFTCSVSLGNSRVIGPHGDSTVTFQNLLQSGYDSVTILRPGGTEYVVYNSDQVRILKLDLLREEWIDIV